jgi:hypothetical protein
MATSSYEDDHRHRGLSRTVDGYRRKTARTCLRHNICFAAPRALSCIHVNIGVTCLSPVNVSSPTFVSSSSALQLTANDHLDVVSCLAAPGRSPTHRRHTLFRRLSKLLARLCDATSDEITHPTPRMKASSWIPLREHRPSASCLPRALHCGLRRPIAATGRLRCSSGMACAHHSMSPARSQSLSNLAMLDQASHV